MNKILPDKHKATLVYTGTKLVSNFNIKDITKKERKHDLVYIVKCPEETCNETYNGETGRRLVNELTQPAITCSKLTIEALEQGVKYAQS